MKVKRVTIPLTDSDIADLHAGDEVYLSGTIYTARDQAHKRLCALLESDEPLPFLMKNQVLYYSGPAPTPPGFSIGSCGPTTSYRMDPYTVPLLENGIKGIIGKGQRNQEIEKAFTHYKAVYFVAVGGLGALLSSHIVSCEEIAFPDLGTESIKRLTIKDFPVFVANDTHGGNIFIDNKV